MANRVFVCAVLALWLGSMSWLVVDRILPSLHEGEAPVTAGYEPNVPVAWRVYWGDREVGHAASVRVPGVLNTTNLLNRVVLEDVPLLDLVPALMRRVVGDIGTMKFDARTNLQFDSLDNFSNFRSRVSINDINPVLELNGKVNGAFLELKVHFSEVTYEPKVPIGDRAALNEALFPDAKLPYMYVGRRWTEEVYNPFRTPTAPVETLEAEVTGQESVTIGEETHRVMRVEYRAQPAPGIPEEELLQAVAWVRAKDGLVLRQDVIISSSKLRFERMPEAEAAEIGKQLLDRADVDFRGWRRGRDRRSGEWHSRRHEENRSEGRDFRRDEYRRGEYLNSSREELGR
ncbi:MAG TPA: hypothetical protein VF175_01975 [Lacipirellula sp.]